MKIVPFQKRSPISAADKELLMTSLTELSEKITDDELIQLAYVAFTASGDCTWGYCGADMEPYRLAGALMAQAQVLLHTYHVAEQLDD